MSEPSEADIAFYRHDAKKAEALYAAAVAKDPADSRSREYQIDSLIEQKKLDEAHTLLEDWVAMDSEDSYAATAAADIRFAEGDWLESYALNLKALKLDTCNADAFDRSARYEELAGFHTTAHRHYAIAHQLVPKDEQFYRGWISGLPAAQRFEENKKYIVASKALDEKQRAAITKSYEKAESESDNRCTLVSSSGPAVIPMVELPSALGQDVHYGLEIAFNGHKRTLQIDTGAGGFLLTHSAGATLSLPGISKSRVGGFGDEDANDFDVDHADSVRIGGLEFKNCVVSVAANFGTMGGSQIQGNRMDSKDGIVGTDIFDRYLVTLDYIKHEVRLDPLPRPTNAPSEGLDPLGGSNNPDRRDIDRYTAPSMKNWTQVYRSGHMLYIPTRINGTLNKPFVLDTGSYINIIDTNLAKTFTKTQSGMVRSRGLSGVSDPMSQAGRFTADFAGIRLPVQSMDSQDLSRWGQGIAGFLGYPTLEQLIMHIDYRDNLVLFEAPNGKKN